MTESRSGEGQGGDGASQQVDNETVVSIAASRAAAREVERRRKLLRVYILLVSVPLVLAVVVWLLPRAERTMVAAAAEETRASLSEAQGEAASASKASAAAEKAAGEAMASAQEASEALRAISAALEKGAVSGEAPPDVSDSGGERYLSEILARLERQSEELGELRRQLDDLAKRSLSVEDLSGAVDSNRATLSGLQGLIADLRDAQSQQFEQLREHMDGLEPTFYRSWMVPERGTSALPGLAGVEIRLDREADGVRVQLRDSSGRPLLGETSALDGRLMQVGSSVPFEYEGTEYFLILRSLLKRWGPARDFVQIDVYRYRRLGGE